MEQTWEQQLSDIEACLETTQRLQVEVARILQGHFDAEALQRLRVEIDRLAARRALAAGPR